MLSLDISGQVCVPLRGLLMNCYMQNVTRIGDMTKTASGMYVADKLQRSQRSGYSDYNQYEHFMMYDTKSREWLPLDPNQITENRLAIEVNGRIVGVYHYDLCIEKTKYGFRSNQSVQDTIEHQKCISMLLRNLGLSLNQFEIGTNANQAIDNLLL